MKRNCGNCKFAVEFKRGYQDPLHICHWGPPQVLVREDGKVNYTFPLVDVTNDNFWCGQHKPRGRSKSG